MYHTSCRHFLTFQDVQYHCFLTIMFLLGVMIYNCNNNKVEIFEDTPAPVTRGDISRTDHVVWKKDGVSIHECDPGDTCDSLHDYIVSRSPQSNESCLTLVPDYRRHAGVTVTCHVSRVTCHDQRSLSTASCTIVIKRKATFSLNIQHYMRLQTPSSL